MGIAADYRARKKAPSCDEAFDQDLGVADLCGAEGYSLRVLSETLECGVLDLTDAGGGHAGSAGDRFGSARLSAGQAVTLGEHVALVR